MGQRKDWMRCCDCRERRLVSHREQGRAAKPRCLGCGGPLEMSQAAADDRARHCDAKALLQERRAND